MNCVIGFDVFNYIINFIKIMMFVEDEDELQVMEIGFEDKFFWVLFIVVVVFVVLIVGGGYYFKICKMNDEIVCQGICIVELEDQICCGEVVKV